MNTEKMNEETSRKYLDSIALYMRIPRKYKESLTYSDGINRTMKLLEVLGSKELAEKYILEDHGVVKDLFTGPNPNSGLKVRNAAISGAHRATVSTEGPKAIILEDIDIFMDKFRRPNSIREQGESEIDLTRPLRSEQDSVLKDLLEEALEERRRWKLEATPEQIVGRIRTRHQSPYLYGIPSVGDIGLYDIVKGIVDFNRRALNRKDTIHMFERLGCRNPKTLGNTLIKKLMHKEQEQWLDVVMSALINNDPYRFGELRSYIWFRSKMSSKAKVEHKNWTESELLKITLF